jgi:hypothetical protein
MREIQRSRGFFGFRDSSTGRMGQRRVIHFASDDPRMRLSSVSFVRKHVSGLHFSKTRFFERGNRAFQHKTFTQYLSTDLMHNIENIIIQRPT